MVSLPFLTKSNKKYLPQSLFLRSMHDTDGPFVIKEFYETMFREESVCLNLDDVPYALDTAVQKLRIRGVHPARWSPYIHIGL